MPGSLPDFVIIGATKSATTWLLQNLQAHPQIFMPDPELHFFSRQFERGEAWYRAQFAGAPPDLLLGEKSASYLPHPAAPARLRALLPRARLIVQLRNPIERAYSDYCMHYRRGQVGRRIARYLDPAHPPIPRLLEDGLYCRHLHAFLALFPAAQLKIVLYDDVRSRPAALFDEICEHLDVARQPPSALLTQRIKNREARMVPPLTKRTLGPLLGLVEPWREQPEFRLARSLLARRIDYPKLSPALWQQLADYYRADVAALGRLLGRDLGHWLVEREERTDTRRAALAQSSSGASAA